jgi:hypothetical protein
MSHNVKITSNDIGHKNIMIESGEFSKELQFILFMRSSIDNNKSPIALMNFVPKNKLKHVLAQLDSINF